MKLIFSLVALFILCSNTYVDAQVVIVDESKTPVSYVNLVISNKSSTFWQSDRNGVIPQHVLQAADKKDTLKLQHISYQDKEILLKDLHKVDTILLTPFLYELNKVEISSKSPKYQRISACFRSVRFKNGHPMYYSDGEIAYLAKTKSLNYKVALGEHRAFENKKLSKYLFKYKTSIPMGTATIPLPEKNYLPSQLIKKYDLTLVQVDSGLTKIKTEKDSVIGHIKEMGDVLEFKIDLGFTLKRRKAFNTVVDENDFHLHMIFRNHSPNPEENYRDFGQLLYSKWIYNYSLKHDKEKRNQK